jgi:hypothetical protein
MSDKPLLFQRELHGPFQGRGGSVHFGWDGGGEFIVRVNEYGVVLPKNIAEEMAAIVMARSGNDMAVLLRSEQEKFAKRETELRTVRDEIECQRADDNRRSLAEIGKLNKKTADLQARIDDINVNLLADQSKEIAHLKDRLALYDSVDEFTRVEANPEEAEQSAW